MGRGAGLVQRGSSSAGQAPGVSKKAPHCHCAKSNLLEPPRPDSPSSGSSTVLGRRSASKPKSGTAKTRKSPRRQSTRTSSSRKRTRSPSPKRSPKHVPKRSAAATRSSKRTKRTTSKASLFAAALLVLLSSACASPANDRGALVGLGPADIEQLTKELAEVAPKRKGFWPSDKKRARVSSWSWWSA